MNVQIAEGGKMRRINSTELLAVGRAVQVGSRLGVVCASALVPAHPCGQVALHHVQFTHRVRAAIAGVPRAPELLARPVVEAVSYVAIWA